MEIFGIALVDLHGVHHVGIFRDKEALNAHQIQVNQDLAVPEALVHHANLIFNLQHVVSRLIRFEMEI